MRKGALVGLCLAIGLAGCGSNQSEEELAAAREQIKKEKAAATETIERDQQSAEDELSAAANKAARKRREYADQKRKIAAQQERLDELQRQVSGARVEAAKNTIPGTGTFVVGTDINPGTYRATAQPGCYWARLSSLDSNDIIENDNADGPVVIEILTSDKAINTSGCADFHRAE